jgi:hypothetical protein
VEVPLLLQFSIALSTGMVAATLIPSVRRSIPRPIEVVMWTVLVVACVFGVLGLSNANANARELTTSAFWGVDRVINTLVGLLGAGVVGWLAGHRFAIATLASLVCGIDVLALALIRSHRQSLGWQPRVRLIEWMELPRLPTSQPEPVVVSYAVDELNRKLAAATAIAGVAFHRWLVHVLIWARKVMWPRQAEQLADATAAGRLESGAKLETLRDTAAQLQFAAHAWCTAAGAPAVSELAARASEAVRTARSAQREAVELSPGRVADIHVLLSAQPVGSHGPIRPAPAVQAEEDENESGPTGRLAS